MAEDLPEDHRDPAQVRAVYEEIADHFAETRAYPWPEIESFLDGVDSISTSVDIGCGNGRHIQPLHSRSDRVVGVDVSRGLLSNARDRLAGELSPAALTRTTLLQGDAARLPLATDSVDLALYIATLHHLPDRDHRIASLEELARILRPDGRALVSAWSTEHDRFSEREHSENEGFDTTIDWTLPGGETRERFYHIYAPEEFEADLEASGLTVEHVEVSSGNCYGTVR